MYQHTENDLMNSERLLKSQIEIMIAADQYFSAELLISLFLSSLNASNCISPLQKHLYQSTYLEKMADTIFLQSNYRRSLEIYRQIWNILKQLSIAKTPNKTVKITTLAMTTDEARIKFKESKCLYMLKDNSSALKELEVIPLKYRDVASHMMLGNLYKTSNMKKQAISSYQEALKLMPLSLEAIEALASLGETYQDITAIISDAARQQSTESLYDSSGWLFDYIHVLIHKRNGDYEKVNAKLHPIMQKFPQNTPLLLQQGICAVETEKYDQAYIIYMQIRKLDPYIVEKMDRFAVMLHHRGDSIELNKLSQDMMQCSTTRPIPWLIMALFCDTKGFADKAMNFVDKAISLDYKYPLSYVLKGKLLMSQGHPKQAAVAYFQANILQKDLMSLSGLIDANLGVGRYNEAINAAKEALVLMPKSSTAFAIMGKVLAKNAKGQNESVRAFSKALKLNPDNNDAALKMAEVLDTMNKTSAAIDCLKDIISKGLVTGKLRIQLAKLYAAQGQFPEAIAELHAAVAIHPRDTDEVTQEFEKVEALMKGENISMQEDDEGVLDIRQETSDIEYPRSSSHAAREPSIMMSGGIASVGALRGRRHDDSDADMDESTYSDEHDGVDRELFAD